MLKLRSVNNIVIAPAKTGSDNNNKKAVIKTAQTNKASLCICMPFPRILKIVHIKFIAPIIDEAPAKCKLKIARSTEAPGCDFKPDNGGYTVQPVPAPNSTKLEKTSNNNDGGNNQKLILFNLGNAISGAPINIGTNQLPKPPIKIGMTIKKIIKKACAVIITLYN